MLIFEEQKVLSEHNLMLEPKLHAWNRKLLHSILQHQNHSCFELSTAKDANYALEFITRHVLRPNYACQTTYYTHTSRISAHRGHVSAHYNNNRSARAVEPFRSKTLLPGSIPGMSAARARGLEKLEVTVEPLRSKTLLPGSMPRISAARARASWRSSK